MINWNIVIVFAVLLFAYLIKKIFAATDAAARAENERQKQSKFVIVISYWFVDSKGHNIVYSDAKTMMEAQLEAKALLHDTTDTFKKGSFVVIPVIREVNQQPAGQE